MTSRLTVDMYIPGGAGGGQKVTPLVSVTHDLSHRLSLHPELTVAMTVRVRR